MPRAKGSTTLAIGNPAPDFDVPIAGTDTRATLRGFAGQWLCLVFVRHVW